MSYKHFKKENLHTITFDLAKMTYRCNPNDPNDPYDQDDPNDPNYQDDPADPDD